MDKIRIILILGTTRLGRRSENVAKLIHQVGEEEEFASEIEIEYVDVARFFPLPGEGNDEESKNPEWVAINQRSDGYFIVMPEYNHGYPGSLKMLLDNDLGNYTHKPVAVAGVSSGMVGGARGVETLLHVLRELGLVATFSNLYFPRVQELFDDAGQLRDDSLKENIRKAYRELLWMAKTLKWGRENL